MNKVFPVVVLTVLFAGCASTETEPEGDDAQATAGETEKSKVRCYREKTTGSRLGSKRICTPAGG